jgi:hypothetical protein
MCVGLNELRGVMRDYSTTFDAALLSCAQAAVVVKDAAAIEHMAATVKALAAARAAEGAAWKKGGFRSPEEELARQTGTSLTSAHDALQLGKRLEKQPEVADAARTGGLSPAQAGAISDAVETDPSSAGRLLEAAGTGGSLAELKNQCAEIKAKAIDLEERRRAIHKRRYLRAWTNGEREGHVHGMANPEDIAQILAALEPLADDLFHQGRRHHSYEPREAYLFDALLLLALNATGTPTTDGAVPMGPVTAPSPPAPDTYTERTGAPRWPADGNGHQAASASPQLWSPESGGPFDSGGSFDSGGPFDDAGATCRPRIPSWSSSGDADLASRGGRAGPATKPGTGAPSKSGPPGPPGPPGPTRQPGAGRAKKRIRRGAPVKILIRVDLDSFLRGFPIDGETCDLVGHGPISVSAVKDIINHGDAFITAILTKGHQVSGVVHLGRKPTAYQRTAIEWLHPTCAVAGCPNTAHLELDHRHDWSRTHITILDWLDALCHHHHQLKTRQAWALVAGTGKRAFVPPDDPSHPNHPPPQGGAP